MSRTYHKNNRLPFVVDPSSIVRTHGRQVNYSRTGEQYKYGAKKVTVGSGGAAKGATTLPVVALLVALVQGALLFFGKIASVTVTVSAPAIATATSISVNALSGPLPSGTVLDFGGGKFARLTAAAAAGATSLTVSALPTALAGGETATYLGGAKVARVLADAAIGATSLTVEPLPFALAAAEYAWAGGTGKKRIPAGTCICEDSNGLVFPRVDLQSGETETAYGFLETDASEDSPTDAESGYSVIRGGNLLETQLPDATGSPKTLSSTYKTEMAANGALFMFDKYYDSRAA